MGKMLSIVFIILSLLACAKPEEKVISTENYVKQKHSQWLNYKSSLTESLQIKYQIKSNNNSLYQDYLTPFDSQTSYFDMDGLFELVLDSIKDKNCSVNVTFSREQPTISYINKFCNSGKIEIFVETY
jgi:hypothetical protein